MTLQETLEYCDFLRAMPRPLIERLGQLAQERCYPASSVLFAEGTAHNEFHVILEGHVRLDMHVPQRGRVPILSAGPGDVLAWSSLVGNTIMTSTGVALVDVKTITFPSDQLVSLCETEHEIGFHFMRRLAAALSRRLVATRLQLLDLYERELAKSLPASESNEFDRQEMTIVQSFAKSSE